MQIVTQRILYGTVGGRCFGPVFSTRSASRLAKVFDTWFLRPPDNACERWGAFRAASSADSAHPVRTRGLPRCRLANARSPASPRPNFSLCLVYRIIIREKLPPDGRVSVVVSANGMRAIESPGTPPQPLR
jgi:hypothetical protein